MDRDKQVSQVKTELLALGVDVRNWGEADGYPEGTAFVFLWRNEETMEVFADNSGQQFLETFGSERFLSPIGYREDVHQVLARNELVTDWANKGQIVVYSDKDAAGFSHAFEARRNAEGRK